MPLAFALLLHAHQPAGNFDGVIEEAYQSAYLPFLQAAARRPWLKLNLHYTGFLLDWLAGRHPEYLEQLRQLLAAGRLELLGGGYYEPILAVIPAADQSEQCARLSDALERHFGLRPRGAWLAERVWEPSLAAVLARAGFDYTMLDDAHFERAGVAADDCHGYWQTEDQGAWLRLLPSNFFLRQALPFRPPDEGVAWLRQLAGRAPGTLVTMGDDLEKFGSWPQTHQHVYTEGWLESFLDRLEAAAAEITTVRLSDALTPARSRGLIYLPTGSYPEMMQWAGSPSWRGFFTRYPEANLMHKTLWDLAHRAAAGTVADPEAQAARLRAEANDAYWHGWFGGLYSPHLRNQVWSALLEADRRLDRDAAAPPVRRWDLDGDGHDEVELRSPELRLLATPADGGTLAAWDWRVGDAALLNSLRRRPEAYHEAIRRRAAANPAHLPGGAPAAAAGLDRYLVYDRYPRAAGRLYLCAADKTYADYCGQTLDEDAAVAGGYYAITACAPGALELSAGGVRKGLRLKGSRLELEVLLPAPSAGWALLEWGLNLLAPAAADRWLQAGGERHGLAWGGEVCLSSVSLYDGWRGCVIELTAPAARAWWVQPLHTVSQAEHGFEALYQGSALAAVFPPGTRRLALAVAVRPLEK